MPGNAAGPIIRVAVVTTPSSSASSLFGIRDTLTSVGVAWETYVTGEAAVPRFEVSFVGTTTDPFVCVSGTEIRPEYSIGTVSAPDIVVVSSTIAPLDVPSTGLAPRMIDWIAAQHADGKQVVSSCSGARVLAEAGLLDGKEATTHWGLRDHFRLFYPRVLLRLEQNLCCADREHRIVTAGGATAWQELVLYLIARHVGPRDAVRAAKFWLIPWQGDLQSPYVAMPRGIPHEDREIAACQAWIADNYARDNPVGRMVEHSGLTRSTFRRRFLEATGYTPMDYVHAVRIEEAKQLLETRGDALDAVGQEVGYEDEASFRKLFKRLTGVTPSEHRRRFGLDRFRFLKEGQQLPLDHREMFAASAKTTS
jgi:transcriptional regulator GlxA family with amidase domain